MEKTFAAAFWHQIKHIFIKSHIFRVYSDIVWDLKSTSQFILNAHVRMRKKNGFSRREHSHYVRMVVFCIRFHIHLNINQKSNICFSSSFGHLSSWCYFVECCWTTSIRKEKKMHFISFFRLVFFSAFVHSKFSFNIAPDHCIDGDLNSSFPIHLIILFCLASFDYIGVVFVVVIFDFSLSALHFCSLLIYLSGTISRFA